MGEFAPPEGFFKGKGVEVFQELEPLLASMASSLDSFYGLKPVFDDMKDSKFIKSVKELGKTVKDMAKAEIQGEAISMLMELLEPFLELIELFHPIFSALGAILMDLLIPAFQFLGPVIATISSWIMKFRGIIQLLIPVVVALLGIFGVLSAPVAIIIGAITALMLVIKHWGVILEGIKIIWETVVGFVVWVLEQIVKGFKWFINGIIDLVNLAFDLLGVGLFFDIPHLAEGGIVTSPTLAVIGEKGPEEVRPLGKGGGGLTETDRVEIELIEMNEKLEIIVAQNKKVTRGLQRRKYG